MATSLEFYKEEKLKKVEANGVIFEIPEDWKTVNLIDYANVLKGFAFSSNFFNEIGKGLPIIRIRDLGKDTTEAYYSGQYDPTYIVERGDLLISMDGEFDIYLWKGPQALLNQRVCKVWSKDASKLDNMYLYYTLKKPLKLIEAQTSHTTVKHLLDRDFERIKIPLPPLSEQRKIAHVLTTIDKAIEEVDKAIKKAERIKKGLMQELLTKGIGHKKFKDTEIGKIPKEWKVVELQDITLLIKCGPFGSQLKRNELTDSGIKVYTQDNVLRKDFYTSYAYISPKKFEQLKSMEVLPGDVLLTIRGTVGKAAVVPPEVDKGIIHTNLAIIRCDLDKIFPSYLERIINDSELFIGQIKSARTSTTLPALYARTIKRLKVPLPPLREQKKIAEILSKWDKVIELKKAKKEKLERMKKKVMELLLTGKVRVK